MQSSLSKFTLLFLIGITFQLNILAQTVRFNHLTVEDGLSNNIVREVIQDQTGFLWFATDDGLNRYDGYNFKIFRHDPNDSNSISDNSIWTLAEDRKGNIWVGTKAGILNRYDPVTGIFSHWKIKSDITEENSITAFCEDSKGNLWIGTYKGGLYKLNLSTNQISNWNADPGDETSLSHNYVQDIIEDEEGNILIATYSGLSKFDPMKPKNGFEKFYHDPDDPNSLSGNLIWRLIQSETSPEIIWICTFDNLTRFNTDENKFQRVKISNPQNLQYGTSVNSIIEEYKSGEKIIWTASYSGLVRINLQNGETKRFVNNDNDEASIISGQINKIIRDRTGIIWIATQSGISYISPKSTLFNSVDVISSEFNIDASLNKKNITAISKSGDNKIWIGSDDGLFLLKSVSDKLTVSKISALDGINIWSLESGGNDKVWIGTYGKGLKLYNYKTNAVINWDIKDPKIRTQSVLYNKSLLEDSNKNLWIGYWGIGTVRLNPEAGNLNVWMHQKENPSSLSHNDVWTIKQDRFGRIWLGTTGGGLNLAYFMDKNRVRFHRWIKNENEKTSLSSNNIYSICEAENFEEINDSTVILWIGTSDGLNRFRVVNKNSDVYDIKTGNEFYTIEDGLPDNSVNSIIEDDYGNLWLGTSSGISFFDVKKKKFTNFYSADGINGSLMNPEAAVKLKNGIILMGSAGGLNIFDPDKIKLSDYKPNLVITDFQIFNNTVEISEDSPLEKSITFADQITLANDQDVFSFEFAALDYNSPGSIEYAYMMEGFDDDWIESGNRRFVTYTNLDPGKYIFKVKSTNADGVWTDEIKSLSIIINPPWWRTIWAYLFYVVLIILGLIGLRRFELNRLKLRNELKLREVEVKQKTELEEIKSRFYANLSHEFRTPLTLIKGPLEQIKKQSGNDKLLRNIDLIERNSYKLGNLIDQLLELSQLEKSTVKLEAKKTDLISTLKGITASFYSLAEQKKIELGFSASKESIRCLIDRDKFEKIINNLLLNALKFTPENGKVEVSAKEVNLSDNPTAEVKISDTGISIPKEKLDNIFDRYFQVQDSTQRSHGGSGIGLALVKEFVELHKWNISVKSEPGKGTEFLIHIPLNEHYLSENEKVYDESEDSALITTQKENQYSLDSNNTFINTSGENTKNEKPTILIVDDSEDVRIYLFSLLESDFNISQAIDGKEGIKAATEILPDLIISDVMMPLMDGLEFCEHIKSEWQTSDIPVILLTAKASFENKIEGLETGADDYLTKPFESRELFTRIQNLLEQRQRIKEKYRKEIDPLSETRYTNTADDEFINKALVLIDENIDKTSFSTEKLAKQLFVSRTQLHRKLMSITGQAPGEFIRTRKLKCAARLLLEGNHSVTQVAFEIGFSSPAQFTRAFTKQFNCVPSEYSSKEKTSKKA